MLCATESISRGVEGAHDVCTWLCEVGERERSAGCICCSAAAAIGSKGELFWGEEVGGFLMGLLCVGDSMVSRSAEIYKAAGGVGV